MNALDRLSAEWWADPEFRATYQAEYPFAGIADLLAERRASMGLTQRAFARRLHVPTRTVRKWESGQHPVPAEAFR